LGRKIARQCPPAYCPPEPDIAHNRSFRSIPFAEVRYVDGVGMGIAALAAVGDAILTVENCQVPITTVITAKTSLPFAQSLCYSQIQMPCFAPTYYLVKVQWMGRRSIYTSSYAKCFHFTQFTRVSPALCAAIEMCIKHGERICIQRLINVEVGQPAGLLMCYCDKGLFSMQF